MRALGANHLVLSNAWRADELITAVGGYRSVPEVEELRELRGQRTSNTNGNRSTHT